jgi:hypothetical protein
MLASTRVRRVVVAASLGTACLAASKLYSRKQRVRIDEEGACATRTRALALLAHATAGSESQVRLYDLLREQHEALRRAEALESRIGTIRDSLVARGETGPAVDTLNARLRELESLRVTSAERRAGSGTGNGAL